MDEQQVSPAQNPAPNADERLERLERQYAASSQEGKRLAAENQQLKVMMEQQMSRPAIPQRQSADERLAELGIPSDAIGELVSAKLSEALAPLTRGFEARGRVMADYPDYNKFESDVAQFVNSDPEFSQRYNRMFVADPVGAMELALLKYTEKQRKNVPSNGVDMTGSADAQLPNGRQGDARRAPNVSTDIEDAFQEFKQTGDAAMYARKRLRGLGSMQAQYNNNGQ